MKFMLEIISFTGHTSPFGRVQMCFVFFFAFGLFLGPVLFQKRIKMILKGAHNTAN